jgi:DNA processing protein
MLSHRHIIALGFLPGITSSALRGLVESGASFEEIVRATPGDLASAGLRRGAIEGMRSIELHVARADEQLEAAMKQEASIIHFWEESYPKRLREIYSPPMVLYVRGELRPEDETAISIVGTRGASPYGKMSAEKYASEFVRAGVTVISGLARGIDQYAHGAALRAGGRTIAVIASGLDEIQPNYSAGFALKIASQGAVVTEYPFGVKAVPGYFPQRNRIISGMTSGTVVVESDEKGGALITASFAMDQSRDVFAVPGPINSRVSRGTNMLIRTDRARLTQTPADVLDALGYHIPAPEATAGNGDAGVELSAFEQRIYDALSGEPLHIDMLGDATGLATSDILVNLLTLEFKGLVRQMAGKMFLRS